MRYSVLFLVASCALVATFSLRIDAQQQTAKNGAYAAAQATTGKGIYATRCAVCHGMTLEGVAGPPLAGMEFLNVWGSQTLLDLFDKIQQTMPADEPGSLAPAQTANVVAYILQVNKFPAGRAAFPSDPVGLKGVALDPTRVASSRSGTAAAAQPSFSPVGTLNQVMRGILFPSSNVLFDVQTQNPSARGKGAAHAEASTTTTRYGDVYEPWQVVDAAAISIAEAAPLLLSPGRRCENGKLAPVDRDDWKQYVRGLVEAGRTAYKASQSRNQQAVSDATNVVSDACANCHRVYRDVPSAAQRCL